MRDKPFTPPATMADTASNYDGKPMWVRNQRNSWHGVDFPYHSDARHRASTTAATPRRCSPWTTASAASRRCWPNSKLLDDTLVVFMGDNGFAFGEHGLIDKRTAYEESMRVPLLMAGAGSACGHDGRRRSSPTSTSRRRILEAAGLTPPAMDGRSFLPLARGERMPWRDALLYEYYWERNFPQTPTMHALRGERYKYIRYHGLWDTDELYDLAGRPARDAQPRARSARIGTSSLA